MNMTIWQGVLASLVLVTGAIPVEAGMAAQGETPPTDFDCAASFLVDGFRRPARREAMFKVAQTALDRHVAATPGENRAEVEQFIKTWSATKAENLKSGKDEVAKFERQLMACEAKFGIAPSVKPLPNLAPPPDTRTPAQLYAAGQNKFLKEERPEKLDLYRRACADGHQPACRDYGMELRFTAAEPTVREALWGLDKACQGKDAEACVEAGKLRDPKNPFAGAKALKDWGGAETSYRRACETLGDSEACEPLAQLLRDSRNPQAKPAEGTAILRMLCDTGRTDICAKLAAEAVRGQ